MTRTFAGTRWLGYGALREMRNLGCILILAATAADAETVTIAALGDSLTQGYGLPPENGFVPQMQAWLDARGADVVLVNAGVSGDTTAGGLARVGWTLTPEVDAMIVALGGNDFLRGIDPANSRANLQGILEVATAQGVEVLLVGIAASTNYGADFKTEFDAMYPALAAEFGAGLYPDWFAGILSDGGITTARETFMQSDGIHPNAEGVARIVEAMGPAVMDLVARIE